MKMKIMIVIVMTGVVMTMRGGRSEGGNVGTKRTTSNSSSLNGSGSVTKSHGEGRKLTDTLFILIEFFHDL